jgi:hypothetical protein
MPPFDAAYAGDADAALEAEERGDVDALAGGVAGDEVARDELRELEGAGEVDLKDGEGGAGFGKALGVAAPRPVAAPLTRAGLPSSRDRFRISVVCEADTNLEIAASGTPLV